MAFHQAQREMPTHPTPDTAGVAVVPPASRQHPTHSHLYATSDGRLYSTKSDGYIGMLRAASGRWEAYVTGPHRVQRNRAAFIWEAWNGELLGDRQADHIDGDTTNDRPDNLRALSGAENTRAYSETPAGALSAVTAALSQSRSINGTRISDGKCQSFASVNAAARVLGLRPGNISHVVSGKRKSSGGWTFSQALKVDGMELQADLPGEVWKTATFARGGDKPSVRVAVSSEGRVKAKNGRISRGTVSNGYYVFSARALDGEAAKLTVSVVICTVFHGARPTSAHQADHIDENKLNNRATNLRWLTPSENVTHSWGRGVIGYDDKGIVVIRAPSLTAAGKARGVSPAAILSAMRYGRKSAGLVWKYEEK